MMDKETFDLCVQIERRMHHLCYATYKCGMDGDAWFTPVENALYKLYDKLGFNRTELNDAGYELAKKDNLKYPDMGTLTMVIPNYLTYNDVRKIIGLVTEITDHEGGRETSLTCSGEIVFYRIEEQEYDRIYDGLVKLFGQSFVDEQLNVGYQSYDEDDLGTICEGCWKTIPDGEDVLYDDNGMAYCEDCYLRLKHGDDYEL